MSQKIRIKLKSYDHKLVDKSAEKMRSYPPSHTQAYLHCKPFYLRQQEGT